MQHHAPFKQKLISQHTAHTSALVQLQTRRTKAETTAQIGKQPLECADHTRSLSKPAHKEKLPLQLGERP
jgi:hypothetical protein